MKTWFISDLHLDAQQPRVIRTFLAFAESLAGQADALYILGDFFEYWVGDDTLQADESGFAPVIQVLSDLHDSGVRLYFQHGNRDFLVGDRFAQMTGCELLPEQHIADLYGTPTLLMHGDSLCTDDTEYQQARRVLRHPQWQQQFLAQPLAERIRQAQAMRSQSRNAMQGKAYEILDVNQQAVQMALQQAGVTRLIHGHTHRPAIHEWQDATGNKLQRVVLGDWHESRPSYLCVDAQNLDLHY